VVVGWFDVDCFGFVDVGEGLFGFFDLVFDEVDVFFGFFFVVVGD